MVRPKDVLTDLQGAFVERLGEVVLPKDAVEAGEVVEG